MPGTPVTTATANASVSGQYDLVLISSAQSKTTTVYINLLQTGTQVAADANTLVCPGNDLSQCKGGIDPATPVSVQGSVQTDNVTLTVTFPITSGSDTLTLIGSVTPMALGGTYTDSLGDSGKWAANKAIYPLSNQGVYNYTGSLNSTINPLTIPPTLALQLGGTPSTLSGSGMVQSWPCESALSASGQQFGDAFAMTDATSKISILAIPAQLPATTNFIFSFRFDPRAPSCGGETGSGTLALQPSPWDY